MNKKPKTRKQLRKEQRTRKKAIRNEYYSKKKLGNRIDSKPKEEKKAVKPKKKTTVVTQEVLKLPTSEDYLVKERKMQAKLAKEMRKQRKRQLLEANEDEDKHIKRLEKQLKLNRRKSKSLPGVFVADGLDYLLEACDSDKIKETAIAEQILEDNDDLGEDFDLITKPGKKKRKKDNSSENSDDEIDEFDESDNEDNCSDNSDADMDELESEEPLNSESEELNSDADLPDEENDADDLIESDVNEDMNADQASDKDTNKDPDGTWEDIYGRKRKVDGSIIEVRNEGKYVPPGARGKDNPSEKVQRLRRQVKGLLNRLAEFNLHSISTQIEALYMNNSRYDMNNELTTLILEAIAPKHLTPERLLVEHVVLITILHANVGTEVGAHFLQTVVKEFDKLRGDKTMENKQLDNIVCTIAHLYNFKIFDSNLIYEILGQLAKDFQEKDIECILHILKNVGFSLRKDNPVALKTFILDLQKRALGSSSDGDVNARVKYMLDILLAIKNNNVTKIPNYDTTHSEHLKKLLKGIVRKGNYGTQMNITLDDLLKADERGKWWIVGSAWTAKTATEDTKAAVPATSGISQKLLTLARKKGMNTDARRNIFYVIVSAEDYLDAFGKLLRLGLKNEREIINVLLRCALGEKPYNPYYHTLLQKFCDHSRNYKLITKYAIWDKVKCLKDYSQVEVSYLAKVLTHLFIENGLSIATLKIVQFGELDKISLRFIRQILLGVLLHDDFEACKGVFDKVSKSDKLKMFKESLRLFFHHFLLRNLESQSIPEKQKELLKERVTFVEKMLLQKSVRVNTYID